MDPPAEIIRKVKKAVTDTDGIVAWDPAGKPGVTNLLSLLGAATGQDPTTLAEDYQRYGDLKGAVSEALIEALAPLQARYAELQADPSGVIDILRAGADQASSVASSTYLRAADAVGLLRS
jgi:tryptophanyl-tRNA synthetase